MATPTTWCLLPVLLVTLTHCLSTPGLPVPPSNLECYKPCDPKDCSVIKCSWDPKPHLDILTNYMLQWKPVEDAEDENVTIRSSSDGFIQRQDFENHGELCVWVQASNQFGSVKSQEIVIHTHDIIKPPPPTFTSSHQDPLEIHWKTICGELQLNVGVCKVRYRTEDDKNWIEYEEDLSCCYSVMEPQPNTFYEFQVRCGCDQTKISDWSDSYRIRSAGSAPFGEVDVWWECSLPLSNCFLTWKSLSVSQARGYILGYKVEVFYNNGTVQLMNVSTDNPSSFVVYDNMKWRLTSSLKDVLSVYISAYNAVGATKASPLLMPTPTSGKQPNDPTVYLKMNEKNLTVSWNLTSKLSGGVKQYVVQYKECGPGNGSDWIKVEKNHTRVFFEGAFKKYTSYQVLLFTVSNKNEVHQFATATGYSAQGVPSTVPSFKASHIAGTQVTLVWEPVPFCNQRGEILYYQIGGNALRGNNVTVSPNHENTYELKDLKPGQKYEVWIRAVTVAGPGEKVTTTFRINPRESYAYITAIVVSVVLVIIFLFVSLLCVFRGADKTCPLVTRRLYKQVPDPSNSQIFRQMKHQINDSLNWICIPRDEPPPKISVLEVLEIKPKVFHPHRINDDQREDPVIENSESIESRYGRKEYSKMLDSDEEKNDSLSSSEEEQSTSGYEKHFMPSPFEIMA